MNPSNSTPQDLHPPRLTRPQRVVQAAAGLLQLPREVVHQIFDDLTVFQVLQLASCRQNYIDDCVLGHPQYCLAFESLEKLAEVRDLFIVFYELRASLDILHPPVSRNHLPIAFQYHLSSHSMAWCARSLASEVRQIYPWLRTLVIRPARADGIFAST